MDRTLRALGLHRKELRAWALYDWANSAFVTTIMGAVLPVYFVNVSSTTLPEELRTAYWGYTQTVALIIIAVTAPFLGAGPRTISAPRRSFSPRSPSSARAARSCCSSRPKASGSSPRWRSSSATSASRPATSSTSRSYLTLPSQTRSTASRPRATPSATSGAGSCSRCTSPGSAGPSGFGSPTRAKRRGGRF